MTEQYSEPTVPNLPAIRDIQARANSGLLNLMMAERYSAYMPNAIRLNTRRVVIGADEDVTPALTERR